MTSFALSSKLRQALVKSGGRPAIEDGGGQWIVTAEQLLASASVLYKDLARFIDRPLILYMDKSPLYYALTACCFLNRLTFCPLDVNNPIQRVVDIASQLTRSVILCDNEAALAQLQEHTGQCMCLHFSFAEAAPVQANETVTQASVDASYYIATSGSTGPPKLVEVPHERTLPFIDWAIPFYHIDKDCRWAQFSSVGFDLSLVDFLCVAAGGGTLVSLSTKMDRMRPAQVIQRSGITHWHSVPSMIPYFLREPNGNTSDSTCRLFTFCGEPLLKVDADWLSSRYPRSRIVNTYGPTEATLFCSFFEYVPSDTTVTGHSLPIGQPIPSWNFVLIPDYGALKLIVLSDNISNGYVGFNSSLFSTVNLFGKNMRAFDTGDYFHVVGRHLYFSHRRDSMVKIHGNRIDLGEIEAAATRAGLVNPVALLFDGSIALVAEYTKCSVADAMTETLKVPSKV